MYHPPSSSHSKESVDQAVRKKPKLESKTLVVCAAADASKGPRDSMEDTHTVREDLKFYGVYDGHGGEQAATILQQTNKWDSGTTAVVALVHGTKLYIANCGDSEAVLGRRKLVKKTVKSGRTRSDSQRSSATSTPLSFALSDGPQFPRTSTPPPPTPLTPDNFGISPTAVLSHLSLSSPRIHSRTNNCCGDSALDTTHSTNTSTLTTNSTPTHVFPFPPSPHVNSLTPNSLNHSANNTTEDSSDRGNTHKRSHSPNNPKKNEECEKDGTRAGKDTEDGNGDEEYEDEEEDEDDLEWEDCTGPSLTDDIEAYLKENPDSFFCHKEGKIGLFEPVVLSCCHRPTCEDEISRITAAGGTVSYGRVLGELGVTRAFGDINYKHPHNKGTADFVCVKPHISVVDLQPRDEFLIMATDGLWDVVSHTEAVDVISKARTGGDSHQACEDLVDEALRKNSFDNVTVVFLSFKWNTTE